MNRLLKNHPNRMCMGKILLFFIILPLIQPAFAWKPITHVYLGKEALDEVDVNYNIPFFEVDYENKQKLDLIDRFEGNQELIDLLRRESDSFYAGILGPDAYPDLPTGQTRIHVACPDGAVELDKSNNYCPANTLHNHQLITDDWLRYIWNNAQNSGQDDVKAFAFGFMVHAAGDMYMHTFVNYFAGGEFSTFSDNGLRHTVIESYVGKRTPALFQNGDEYDIELTSNVSKFIYDFLVNATPDSDLNNKLLVELPLDYTLDNLYTTVSVPRHFSTLRNALNVRIKQYDDKVKAFKDELSPLVDALSDCVDRAIDKTPLNNCNPLSMADLSLKIGAKQLLKDAYVLPRFVFIAYIKNWVNDINEGLAAWPAFSHDVGKILLFNKENQFDKEALAERWEEYRNAHFVKMMGGTVIASTVLTQYNELMDQLYPEAIMEIVENMKTAGRNAFLDIIIRAFTLNQLTREEFVRLINSPEFEINTLINNPDISLDNTPVAIDIRGLNQLMGVQDEAYEDPAKTFDKNKFAPAYNSINMIKLMLLSDNGIVDLYNTLCNRSLTCNETIEHTPTPNAMLGFIRTLDGQNEWQNHDKKMLMASECGLYQQIFMHQTGEETETDESCVRLYTPLLADLNFVTAEPDMTAGGEFDYLPEISLTHFDPDVEIYYTISDADTAHDPTNDPSDSRSHLYVKPFILQAPFIQAKPLTIRAIAFKEGALPSQVVKEEFLITASQAEPRFFPVLQDHQGSVNVSINADVGASIFYTTNGATPDYNSTPYKGDFTLSPGQYTVKAIAYQLGQPQSPVATQQYNVWNADGSNNLSEPLLTPGGSINVVDSIELIMQSFDEGAEIRYTRVESGVYVEPDVTSTKYLAPVTLLEGDWFIAVKAFDPSGVLGPSTTKFINITVSPAVGAVDLPVIEPNGGTFNNKINITISGETTPNNAGNPQRYYTLDGSDPLAFPYLKANYNRFNGLNLDKSSTLKVQALQTGFRLSPIATARFEFVAANPTFTPENGTFNERVEVTLESITLNAKIYYTIDGSEPSEASILYEAPFVLEKSATVRSKAIRSGYADSDVVVANFQVKQATRPKFITQLASVDAYLGQDIRLSATVAGFPLPTYQWYKNGVLLVGETAQRLFLNNIQHSDSADYTLVATNSAGVSESDVATLTVLALPDLPTIDQQPDDKSLLVGETLELNVGIIPTTEKIFFQWYFEGTAIVGANSSNLTIENVSIEHSGSYWVEISNVTGLVRSETADVRVTMDAAPLRPVDYEFAPKILSNPQPRNLAPGDALNLTVVADGLPLPTYLWFHNQAPLDEQQAATLAIDKSVSENAGEYFVVVRNIHGIAVSDPVTVSVKEKTVETSPVDQNSGDVTDLNTGSPADNVEDKQDITKDEGQKPDDQQQADKTATDDAQSSNKTSGSALSPNVLLIWVSLFLALRVCRQLSINFALKSKRFS